MRFAARNKRIINAVKNGMSYSVAAKKFGVSRNAVAGIIYRSKPENREKIVATYRAKNARVSAERRQRRAEQSA